MKFLDRLMFFLPAILLTILWIVGIYYYIQFPEYFEKRATLFYLLNVPVMVWCVIRYGQKFQNN